MLGLRFPLLPLLLGVLLISCSSPVGLTKGGTKPSEERIKDPQIRVISSAEVFVGSGGSRKISTPDLLYAALQALDADRLLTPVDDSAHGKFMQVLATEPNNAIALDGIQNITLRYLQLAEEAMRRGLFVESETMLDRARFVDQDHPSIAGVELALTAEMKSNDLFFRFDAAEMTARSEQAQRRLQEIAVQAKQAEAFFLITAPNDELARWMFSVMREAVLGYRLRGNIELAGRTSIRLRMPTKAEQ
ncbi:MAG: hypothetical protein ACI945_001728 [Pseudohongiellaceae bacterium]|jgi:hypothetical protein